MGKDCDNDVKRWHTEKEKSTAATHSVKLSSRKGRWGEPLAWEETKRPYSNTVVHSISVYSSFCFLWLFTLQHHSLLFSALSFVLWILAFLSTLPAFFFPPNYCPYQPSHYLNIIVCTCHNFPPSPDLSNETRIQYSPHFALSSKHFHPFHCRLRPAL